MAFPFKPGHGPFRTTSRRVPPPRGSRRPAPRPGARKPLLEPLEPRVLLSSDLAYTALADGDLTLRIQDIGGVETLQLVQTQDPAAIFASQALAGIDGSSGFGARIDGNGHDVRLTIDASIDASRIPGGVIFDGGTGRSTLVGPDQASTWRLGGRGSGEVDGVAFSGVERIIGGSDADTLIGPDTPTTFGYAKWTLTGENAGYIGATDFQGIENLRGGAGADLFVFNPGGRLTGLIDGGAGLDSLKAGDGSNEWAIGGADAGTLNDLAFQGIENLYGGAGADRFVFGDGGRVGGVVSGGSGTDVIVGPDAAAEWRIQDINAGTMIGQPFKGIEALIGGAETDIISLSGGGRMTGLIAGGDGSDVLRVPDADNVGSLSGTNVGVLNGQAFSEVENLVGGAGGDTHSDPLGPLPLSADDVVSGLVGGLQAGFDGVAEALFEFIDSDGVFENYVPGILVETGTEGSHESPQMKNLFRTRVDVVSSTFNAETFHGPFTSLADRFDFVAGLPGIFSFEPELALDAMDLDGGNADGEVDWGEAFNVLVVGRIASFLSGATIGDEDGDTDTDAADVAEAIEDLLTSGFGVPSSVDEFFALSVDSATNISSGDDLKVEVGLTLSVLRHERIDLGYEADQLQIVIDPGTGDPTTVPVSGSVRFGALMFGFDEAMDGAVAGDGSDFIFAAADTPGDANDGIRVGVDIGEPGTPELADFSVNVGFLGAEVEDGEFTLDMDALGGANDPSNPDALGFGLDQQGDASGTGTLTADAEPDDVVLDDDVIFTLRVGSTFVSPFVAVTVPAADGNAPDPNTTLADLIDDVDEAISDADADLGAIISVSDSGGTIRLSLGDNDPTPLGFTDTERFTFFASLTADVAPAILGATAAQTINFLLSVGGAVPRRVQVTTTPEDDDFNGDATLGDLSLSGLIADLQAGLDARFGAGTVTAADDGGQIELSTGGFFGLLEITNTLTLDTIDEITQDELDGGDVFSALPDAGASFVIDLEVETLDGLEKPDDTAFDETGTISVDLDPFDQDDDLALTSDLTVVTVDSADDEVRLTFVLEDSGGLALADPGSGSDMQVLLDFNVLNTAQMIGLIGQVGAWLDRLATSDLMSEFGTPFAGASLGEFLSFKDLVEDTLLIDDKDNGSQAESDDIHRLLAWVEVETDQFELQPQFATAQELGDRLAVVLNDIDDELGSGLYADDAAARDAIDPTYDPATKELTYNLSLSHDLLPEPATPSGDPNAITVPLDFALDLGPVEDVVVSSGEVTINASGTFDWTLGVTLGDAARALTEDSLLSEVNSGAGITVNDNLALTTLGVIEPIVGRLSSDAQFRLTVFRGDTDPDADVTVTLARTLTDDNTEIEDLADDLDLRLAAAGVTGIDADHDGERIVLKATDDTITSFRVDNTTRRSAPGSFKSNAAFAELGLQTEGASTVSLTSPVPVSAVNPGGDVTFDVVVYRNDGVADSLKPVTVSGGAGNATLADLVADVNAALVAADLGDIVASQAFGHLVLSALAADIDSFSLTPTGDAAALERAVAIGLDLEAAQEQLKDVGVDATAADAITSLVAGISLRAEGVPDSPFGRLGAGATFTIDAGALSESITALKTATDANVSVSDLVKDLNEAINGTTLEAKIVAENDGQHIRLRAIDPTIVSIEVSDVGTDEAEDLGLDDSSVARTLAVTAHKAAPVSFGVSANTSFDVTVDYTGGDSVTEPVTLLANNTVRNASLFDLAADLNNALNLAFSGSASNPLLATVQTGQIVIGLKTGSGTGTNLIGDAAPVAADVIGFEITAGAGDAASQLRLVPAGGGTNMADHADFVVSLSDTSVGSDGVYRITLDDATFDDDNDGLTPEVPLVGADHKLDPSATVGDLIAAIEEDVPGGHLTVTLATDGTSLLVRDNTFTIPASADREFSIQVVNGSPAALQLGIFGSDTTQLDLGQFDVTENGRPDGQIEGTRIAVVELLDRFFIEQGSGDILSAELALSVDAIGADATFGFVAIELSSGAQDLYEADFALGLEGSRATLGELFVALGDLSTLRDAVADPTLEASTQDFTVDVALKSGFDPLGLPAGASLTFNLNGALGSFATLAMQGAPLLTFDDAGGADTITRSDDGSWLEDGFAIGQEIAVTGSTGNDGTYVIADVSHGVLTLTSGAELTDEEDAAGVAVTGPDEILFTAQSFVPDEVDLGDLANFEIIDFDAVLAALDQISRFLQKFDELDFLGTELPLLGVSIDDLLDIADRFADAVEAVQQNPAGGVQLLQQKISEAFGLPTDPAEVTALLANLGIPDPSAALIDFALKDFDGGVAGNDFVRIDLRLPVGFSRGMSLDLDLGDVAFLGGSAPIDLQGGAGLNVTGFLDARLSFGVDLSDPTQIWLFDDATGIAGGLSAGADNVTFNAAIGPLGAFIRDGRLEFNLDVNVDNGTFNTASDSKLLIDDIEDIFDAEFTPVLTGTVEAVLPVFFPTEFEFLGDIALDITGGNALTLSGDDLVIPDLGDVLALPDFTDIDLSAIDPFGSIPLMLDSLDFFLQGLQDILDGQVFGFEMPFIGDQLSAGADFIEDLRVGVLGPIRQFVEQAPELGQELVQALLFSLLGPGSGDGPGGAADVTIDTPSGEQDLSEFLGLPSDFGGLGLLVDYELGAGGPAPTIGDIVLGTEDTDTDGEIDDRSWKFRLGDQFSPPVDVAFDLGFPALGLDMNAKLDVDFTWDLALGLGISRMDGAYIFIGNQRSVAEADDEELILAVDVALIQPGGEPVLRGRLGFLQLDIEQSSFDDPGLEQDDTHFHADFRVDLVNGGESDDEKLSFSELGSLSAEIDLNADAEVNLEITAAFNEEILPDAISALLPSVSTRFVLDWEVDGALQEGFEIGDSLDLLAFRDVTISMGSFLTEFLGPIVEKVQEITEPLQPIIDVITAPIPVISDLAGQPVTLVDIAGLFGYVEPAMIYAIADIVDLINTIDGASGELNYNLGSFALVDLSDPLNMIGDGFAGSLSDPNFSLSEDSGAFSLDGFLTDNDFGLETLGDFVAALDAAPGSGNVKQITTGMLSGTQAGSSGFAFPIFEDPGQMLGLLFGRDIALVTYDLAPFGMDFTYTQKFPIWGPLFGRITGSAGLTIDLAFGYDTFGVRQFAEGGFENPLDLLGGFFVSDTDLPAGTGGTDVPELVLRGELFAGAELNLGIASAGAEGGIILTVNFDLHDPDGDGRVRVDELVGNFLYELNYGNPVAAPIAIFDVFGDVSAQLRAFIEFLFFTKHFEITPPITLFEFSIDFAREPILGTERGDGTLLLHAGPNAGQRLNGDIRDIGETLNVRAVSDSEVLVWGQGVGEGGAQSYSLGSDRTIHWFGGEGDDEIVLDLSDGPNIRFALEGGTGDDRIEFTGGGAGGGFIDGGLGNDRIISGSGADAIVGGQGNDTIDGGAGDDVIFGDTGTLSSDDQDNDDPGDDVRQRIRSLVGDDDGADTIHGGEDDDVIFGGGNFDTISGDAGDDLILGDGGNFEFEGGAVPMMDGRVNLAAISDRGAGARDLIYGNPGNDTILGGAGDDQVDGGADNDQIAGGIGFDVLYGGSGEDRIFGGDHDDIIFGEFDPEEASGFSHDAADAGPDGDDTIEGQEGNDYIRGNGANDTILGNRGADIIFGDTGNDILSGEAGPDIMFGGADDDTMEAGDGGDIVFGDDGLVVYLGFHDPAVAPFTPTGSLIRTDAAGVHKLIGDGPESLIDGYETEDDDNDFTMDLMVAESLATDGSDTITGGDSKDVIFGGGGALDTIFGDFDPAVTVLGPRPSGQDLIIGDGGRVEQLTRRYNLAQALSGSFDGQDAISGNDGGDFIFGGGDSDTIFGFENASFGNAPLDGVSENDVILGDNGVIEFDSTEPANRIEKIYTTEILGDSGASDTAFGNLGDDVILGGRNSSADVLDGDTGNDVILGDNGELIFDSDADLDTLDLISSYRDGLGGGDIISGDAGDDALIGGTGGDEMYGDDATASNGDADGEDIMLGDNADVILLGTEGRLLVQVAAMPQGTAVDFITTTDAVETTGGADTMSGSARTDIVIGGVNDGGEDTLYGDRAVPTATTIADDGDDILVGDNGSLDFTFDADTDRNTLDLIRSFEETLGGTDVISGNKGADVAIGGTAGDVIYGDDAAASAAESDLGDALLGDNADIFLVAAGLAAGGDLKLALDTAVKTIRTTDEEHPEYGGSDTISGNADGDIIAGGVQGDTLYGDREVPNATTIADEGDDLVLGDNAALEWLSDGRLPEIVGIDIAANNPALWAKYGTVVADDDLTTLDLITTEQPTSGGRDTVFGDEGDDLVFGGTDLDTIYGDDGDEEAEIVSANRDVLFGDHGRLYRQFSALSGFNSRNFFAIDVGDADGGEGDRMRGEEGDDVLLGQQGDDRMWGGSGDDDMMGGHNVSGGYDELTAPGVVATLNPPVNDLMDGGSGDDAMVGDNAILWRRGDDLSPRFRQLAAATIYTTTADDINTNVGSLAQSDPDDAVGRDIELVDHSDAVEATPLGRFGDDLMAGGGDADTMFGQLGDDLLQGDGFIGADDADPATITFEVEVTDSGVAPDTDETLHFNVPEQVSDGDDYMEGSGGDDLMYGGLGEDDMLGGSSAQYGLTTESERPDGSDRIFGGAGIDISRSDIGDATVDSDGLITTVPTGHARDADYIMGDNANVFRLVNGSDQFRTFVYDDYAGGVRIVPRAMQQLDYTLGGADFAGGVYVNGAAQPAGQPADNGAADLIHGESGDDIIFGMTGSDVMFGEGQDDDILGGYGHDWISGGTGQDGVLGDDGLISTSRNNATVGEPLYGISALLASDPDTKNSNGNVLNEVISTPGDLQIATINVAGELKKSVDLVPFSFDPGWLAIDDEFPDLAGPTPFADDIVFGGLGSDFLHGASGDDSISGAEALEHAYVPVYNAGGVPIGVSDLGYSAVGIPGPVNPGDVLAFRTVDIDGQHLNNRFRAGEFPLYDEFDPRRVILLTNSGELSKDGTGFEFLLNFDQDEGVLRPGGVTPGNPSQSVAYGPVHDDGKDAIFGDLGNDWLVGGTGRDDVYGGWGNDLLNADDDHRTHGSLNDEPDTHPTYEDRAYGGAGRDVLIGNTGGDRLIDWVGEYNSYLVPYAPFGQASVSRTLQPFLPEFLYALSKADGADRTRANDTGADPARNGEPDAEMGLVLQKDFAWQDQTGAPADPQAGNIPGGKRDVLRSAGFNDGTMSGFAVDTGVFVVESGALRVAAESLGQDATAVFYVDEQIPSYYEVLASIRVEKPTGGWKGNAYLVFDYFSATDFKFAGIDVSTNKVVMGQRDASGWHVTKDTPWQVKPAVSYNIMLAVNGTGVSLTIDNRFAMSHSFAPRLIDGRSYGLNMGMVGLGSDNSRGTFDNVTVQRVPPEYTLQATEQFGSGTGQMFGGSAIGTWQVSNGRYEGTAPSGGPAVSLVDLGIGRGLETNAILELSAKLHLGSAGVGGFIFDRYADNDYKLVTIDETGNRILIGHVSPKTGLRIDASFAKAIDAGIDYTLALTLKGTTASVTLNGQAVGSFVFNGVTLDGDFGLLSTKGKASFDSVTIKTNDRAFVPGESGPSLVPDRTSPSSFGGATTDPSAGGDDADSGARALPGFLVRDWIVESRTNGNSAASGLTAGQGLRIDLDGFPGRRDDRGEEYAPVTADLGGDWLMVGTKRQTEELLP